MWISFYFSFLWFIVLPASKNSCLLPVLENSPALSSNIDFPHPILLNSNQMHIILSYSILCVSVCFAYFPFLILFGPLSLSMSLALLPGLFEGPFMECISEMSFGDERENLFIH